MRLALLRRPSLLAAGATVTFAFALPGPAAPPIATAPDALGMHLGAARLESAGALTFGEGSILFLADARAATLYAFDLGKEDPSNFKEDRYAVQDLDQKVAALLGTTRDRIRFRDMTTSPVSGNLYLSVTRLGDEGNQPALVRVRGAEQVELVNLDHIRHSSAPLLSATARDTAKMWGQPRWAMTITDLNFVDGELWVAGLSNEQFASALRRMPFPFGKGGALTTVEIYHTSHNRWETAAPIEAFLPITLNGTPSVIAGYGCSPIATFKVADLKAGGHRRGRTVAELGGGSRPIDMLRYEKDGKEFILIANSARTLMRIDPTEVSRAPELTTSVSQAYEPAGVGYLPVASSGVMQMAAFGKDFVALMVRDAESGVVNVELRPTKWL